MITIQVNDQQVLSVLGELNARLQNLSPAMKEIGEDVVASTKARFASASAPDGTPWAPNSPVTLERYLGLYAGAHKKDGTLSAKGAARSAAKKPLTGETRALQSTINYQQGGNSSVRIGSPMVYGAMQQFGGTRAQFPNLWGDIPARPFLGLSDADKTGVLEVLASYLSSSG
jgi:phage gpG-like protein